MRRCISAALVAIVAAVTVAAPALAVPLGRQMVEREKATVQTASVTASDTVIVHEMPAGSGDKAVLVERTKFVLVHDESGTRARLVSEVYLFLIDGDLYDVAAIAADPELCAIPACRDLPEETIAEVADRARMSIMRQQESGKPTISAGSDARAEKASYRRVAIVEPKREEPAQPVALMNVPTPWWQDWLSPTTVLGLIGSLIAGSTAWFAIAHQRHQMRIEQRAADISAAAATAATPAVATAAPLVQSPGPSVSQAPARTRSRSAAADGGQSPTRRSRSRA